VDDQGQWSVTEKWVWKMPPQLQCTYRAKAPPRTDTLYLVGV
jgi:hypothetical protein